MYLCGILYDFVIGMRCVLFSLGKCIYPLKQSTFIEKASKPYLLGFLDREIYSTFILSILMSLFYVKIAYRC